MANIVTQVTPVPVLVVRSVLVQPKTVRNG